MKLRHSVLAAAFCLMAAAPVEKAGIFAEVAAREASFERRAAEIGIVPAFRENVAPDAIMFLPHPVRIAEKLEGQVWPGTLRWRPTFMAASRDGSMALSIGPSRWKTSSAVELGYYVTIWQRQGDNVLRFVLDRGTIMSRDLYAQPSVTPETQIADGRAAPSDTIATAEAGLARDARTSLASAILTRLDRRGRLLRDEQDPAVGARSARLLLGKEPRAMRYDAPLLVRTTPGGDFGYAYGKATWTSGDRGGEGYWLRVWQKRAGSMRIVLDHLQALPAKRQ